MKWYHLIPVALLTGCSTITKPDCAVGEINSNASPILGASFIGQHIVATLGKTDAQVELCARILEGAMELKKAGKL